VCLEGLRAPIRSLNQYSQCPGQDIIYALELCLSTFLFKVLDFILSEHNNLFLRPERK
jgi:hypothetical protein